MLTLLLFGVRGKSAQTFDPGRRQVNIGSANTRTQPKARGAMEQYEIFFEQCSPGPALNCSHEVVVISGLHGAIRTRTSTDLASRWMLTDRYLTRYPGQRPQRATRS
jgi:hypothetical protein